MNTSTNFGLDIVSSVLTGCGVGSGVVLGGTGVSWTATAVVAVVGSRVQYSLPSGADVPEAHGSQTLDAAPTLAEKYPCVQLTHAESPVMFLYVPATHCVQLPTCGPVDPGGHASVCLLYIQFQYGLGVCTCVSGLIAIYIIPTIQHERRHLSTHELPESTHQQQHPTPRQQQTRDTRFTVGRAHRFQQSDTLRSVASHLGTAGECVLYYIACATATIAGYVVSVVAYFNIVDHHPVSTHGGTYIGRVVLQHASESTFDSAIRRAAISVLDITIVAALSIKPPRISTYCGMCDARRACEAYAEMIV